MHCAGKIKVIIISVAAYNLMQSPEKNMSLFLKSWAVEQNFSKIMELVHELTY